MIHWQECILRFPHFGFVKEFNDGGRFLFIEHQRRNIFAHAKNNLIKGLALKKCVGVPCLFIPGKTPHDDRTCAVSWIFQNDANWPEHLSFHNQNEWAKQRQIYFQNLSTKRVSKRLDADWFRKIWESDEAAPQTLEDTELFNRVKSIHSNELNELSKSDLNRFLLALQDTPYAIDKSLRPTPICRKLATLKFEEFFEEEYVSLSRFEGIWTPLKPKFLEWILRASIEVPDSYDKSWKGILEWGYPWEKEVALKLLKHGLPLTGLFRDWLGKLASQGSFLSIELKVRVTENSDEMDFWIDHLPEQKGIKLLTELGQFEHLLALLKKSKSTLIREAVLEQAVIAIDIESDGDEIHQIGVAAGANKRLIYCDRGDGESTDINEAKSVLLKILSDKKLVIGHNIIEWDWPILTKLVPDLARISQLWDTMLIEFLLHPWSDSFALGGKHQADTDAFDCYRLFKEQIGALPNDLVAHLLSAQFGSTQEFIKEILKIFKEAKNTTDSQPVLGSKHFAKNKPPQWANAVSKHALFRAGQHVYVSKGFFNDTCWVPGLRRINDELSGNLEMSFKKFSHFAQNYLDQPMMIVLEAVLQHAQESSVQVLHDMLPFWIQESLKNSPDFLPACSKRTEPQPNTISIHRLEECTNGVPTDALIVVPQGVHSMEIESKWLNQRRLPASLRRMLEVEIPRRSLLLPAHNKSELESSWHSFDYPAWRLGDGTKNWKFTRVLDLKQNESQIIQQAAPSPSKLLIGTSSKTELFPCSENLRSYWIEALHKFTSIGQQFEKEPVALLFTVVSTRSQNLISALENALQVLSLSPKKFDFWSRSRWVQAGLDQGKKHFVCTLSDLPSWQKAVKQAGLKVVPIVETFPLDEWWMLTPTASSKITNGSEHQETREEINLDNSDDEELIVNEDFTDIAAVTLKHTLPQVSQSDLFQGFPLLMEKNLKAWLFNTKLSKFKKIFVIDPRANDRLNHIFDFCQIERLQIDQNDKKMRNEISEALSSSLGGIEREDVSNELEPLREFFKKYWGYEDFREKSQLPAVDAIRKQDSDVLITLPTGEGKSVLFQVPALYRGLKSRRLTVVVSPLKALMRDQVNRLHEIGFFHSVDYLSGDRTWAENEDVYQGILDHRIALLYIAPERFRNKRFTEALQRRWMDDGDRFEFFVIDEAHCVSQWGYEFRPDYLYAMDLFGRLFREKEPSAKTPLLLLSATVTAATRNQLDSLREVGTRETAAKSPLLLKPDEFWNPIRKHIGLLPKSVEASIRGNKSDEWHIGPRLNVIIDVAKSAKENQTETGQASTVIVFVNRRKLAEELAMTLGEKVPGINFEYFHAGMDSTAREDVYLRFKNQETNVLIATKAFGMGMDIPHIHWAIHFSPPTYLEDYLQEVGRIGRGQDEREKAGLNRLDALLLHNDDDFESNSENIQRGLLAFPEIKSLWEEIAKNSKPLDNNWVALIPDAGYENTETGPQRRNTVNRVRKTLYWLENIGQIEVLGVLPALLPVTLHAQKLCEIAKGDGNLADISSLLLNVEKWQEPIAPHADGDTSSKKRPRQTEPSGLFNQVISAVSGLFGFKFDAPAQQQHVQTNSHSPAQTAAADTIINLEQIWKHTKLQHPDDLLERLVSIQNQGGLEIRNPLSCSKAILAKAGGDSIEEIFEWLSETATDVARRLITQGEMILDFDDLGIVFPEIFVDDKPYEIRQSLEWSITRVLRHGGVSFIEKINKEDQRQTIATIDHSQKTNLISKTKALLKHAHHLWPVMRTALRSEGSLVEFKELVMASVKARKRFRKWEMNQALTLLSTMRLCQSTEPPMTPVYILGLKDNNAKLDEAEHPKATQTLQEINRMSVLRGEAMEIFAHLPGEGERDSFIQSYFEIETPETLQEFLEDQLLQVESGDSKRMDVKLAQLRRTEVANLFERYKREDCEEPNQWRAIRHPYDQHLLVNAGPGSGKTAVLLARVVHLIHEQNLRPEEILVLAFNRAVVFEIRQRLKQIFTSLGYGAYVRRVRIHTFHAFATMNIGRNFENDENDRQLYHLAEWLNENGNADVVSKGLKAILVDEFQDSNEAIFNIITTLQQASGAHVFAIGDDDQDIVRWMRKPRGEFGAEYFQAFNDHFGLDPVDQPSLKVNFRSGSDIVGRSQKLLSNFFKNVEGYKRLKTDLRLSPSSNCPPDNVTVLKLKDYSSTDHLEKEVLDISKELLRNCQSNGESLAILCNTNAEVTKVFRELSKVDRQLNVHSNNTFRLANTRHIAFFLDICKQFVEQNGNLLLNDDLRSELFTELSELDIPENDSTGVGSTLPLDLWNLCIEEISYPRIGDLIDFVSHIKNDEIVRMLGDKQNSGQRVVSTIHKIKGLEFDRVVLFPCCSSFAAREANYEARVNSAIAEALLYYVAMTRAKKNLVLGWGKREKSWKQHKPFEGGRTDGAVFNGLEEIDVSWSAYKQYWGSFQGMDCKQVQDYLGRMVKADDKIVLKGQLLQHNGQPVARLANGSQHRGSHSDQLTVEEVSRYQHNPEHPLYANIHPDIQKQGWHYVVRVNGII